MRLLAFLEYAAVLVGIAGMLASKTFYLPKGFDLGLFLVGAGIALGGLESIITRQMGFRFATHAGERSAGAPAVIFGLMALFVGVAIIAAAYLMDQGAWRSTVAELVRRPGPLIAAGGLMVSGAGALVLLASRSRRGVWWTLFVRFPRMVLGVLLLGAGVAGVGLGAWEWRDPHGYNRFVRQARYQFDVHAERVRRNVTSHLR